MSEEDTAAPPSLMASEIDITIDDSDSEGDDYQENNRRGEGKVT